MYIRWNKEKETLPETKKPRKTRTAHTVNTIRDTTQKTENHQKIKTREGMSKTGEGMRTSEPYGKDMETRKASMASCGHDGSERGRVDTRTTDCWRYSNDCRDWSCRRKILFK